MATYETSIDRGETDEERRRRLQQEQQSSGAGSYWPPTAVAPPVDGLPEGYMPPPPVYTPPKPPEPYTPPPVIVEPPPVETTPTGDGTPEGPNQQQELADRIRDRFMNAPEANTFSFQGRNINIPQFNPTVNPFSYENQNVAGPERQGFSSEIESAIMGNVRNPSRYDSDMATRTFDQLSGRLGEGYDVRRQQAMEMAARSGTINSTIPAGRFSDIAGLQGRAESDLATNIARERANTWSADQQSALGLGMGLEQQRFGQDERSGQFRQNELQRQLANMLGVGNFNRQLGLDQFEGDMASGRFERGVQGDRFAREAGTFGLNEAAEGRAYNQERSSLNDLLGYGQQGFENQMATNEFNRWQDIDWNNLLNQGANI